MSHIPAAAAAAEALPQVSSSDVPRRRMHGLQEQGAAVATAAEVNRTARRVAASQGMKDLNLRDEARFQQAPQPDMVSSQVGWCVQVPLAVAAAGPGLGGDSGCARVRQ
jgi:hypothetical protein